MLKLAKNGYIIMSVLFMVLGACLIIWPDCSMAVFCTAVGIMLIVYGLIKILGYFSRDIYCLAFQFDLAFGVLLAAVGIIIIVRRNVVVNLIFGIFGLLILAAALIIYTMIKNLLISAAVCVIGEIILAIIYVVNSSFFSGGIQKVLNIVNLSSHFDNFANSIFDIKGILYFVSVIAVCLFLTVQSIAKRRWN